MTTAFPIKIKSWRFKPEYIRSKHLGPVTLPAERKKAEKTYALMQSAPLRPDRWGRA